MSKGTMCAIYSLSVAGHPYRPSGIAHLDKTRQFQRHVWFGGFADRLKVPDYGVLKSLGGRKFAFSGADEREIRRHSSSM
jgi:hypothetical protein